MHQPRPTPPQYESRFDRFLIPLILSAVAVAAGVCAGLGFLP